jgi:ATP-binding cassette subfamily G (WHITE) protein 2 (PDR)
MHRKEEVFAKEELDAELQRRHTIDLPTKATGFAFKSLRVDGIASEKSYQPNFATAIASAAANYAQTFRHDGQRVPVLGGFDGLVTSGQTLLVLGRPGNGCSTLLKTIGGNTRGLQIGHDSVLNYQGRYEPLFTYNC